MKSQNKLQNLLPKLVNLGLTHQEAGIYLTLIDNGVLPATTIAKRMNILPHAVYRAIKKLEDKKLVSIITSSPLTFYVLPPELALSAYAKEKAIIWEKEAKDISTALSQKQAASPTTKMDFIPGKLAFYNVCEELINKSKKEVLIVSIGEPSTPDLILANRRAIERGVVIRFIAHKYNKENEEFLRNLQKNGLEIRHYPDWGFHLQIVDEEKALLAINNPKNSAERVAISINSSGFCKALRDYFYSVWEKAVVI